MATTRGRIVKVFHVLLFVLDTCIYGDYKGPYTNGLSCALIVTSAQWNCYNDAYYDDCCLGCPSIYNASMIGRPRLISYSNSITTVTVCRIGLVVWL